MKRKILLSLIVLVAIFILTGCSSSIVKNGKKIINKNKIYTCEYTKKDTGKQTIVKRAIELNKKGEPVYYHYTFGYSNIDDKDKYNSMCDETKEATKNEKVVAHKDSVFIETVCNEKNNYQVYMIVKYDVNKLKGDEDFKGIDEYVTKYIKEDGTFDTAKWKKSFSEDNNEGKYKCDF